MFGGIALDTVFHRYFKRMKCYVEKVRTNNLTETMILTKNYTHVTLHIEKHRLMHRVGCKGRYETENFSFDMNLTKKTRNIQNEQLWIRTYLDNIFSYVTITETVK